MNAGVTDASTFGIHCFPFNFHLKCKGITLRMIGKAIGRVIR